MPVSGTLAVRQQLAEICHGFANEFVFGLFSLPLAASFSCSNSLLNNLKHAQRSSYVVGVMGFEFPWDLAPNPE
jgi:hypothetical protein